MTISPVFAVRVPTPEKVGLLRGPSVDFRNLIVFFWAETLLTLLQSNFPGRSPGNPYGPGNSAPVRSTSEISFSFGRDPGTLKSDIVSKKHPQLICSDLRLSN